MRVPHVSMPEASFRNAVIEINDLVRIMRVAQEKYLEDAEILGKYDLNQSVEHFKMLAEQCGVYAYRFERMIDLGIVESEIEDDEAPYSFTFVTSIGITSVLDHTCPRCNGGIPNDDQRGQYSGAISRLDNSTEICSSCGVDEAWDDYLAGRAGVPSM